jgi:hypothetical protein
MQLKYGSYAFAANSVKLASHVETLWNAGGQPYAQKRSLQVEGYLTDSSQDNLIQDESALRTALGVSFKDLLFYGDDGTAAPVGLANAGSISGVQVHDLEFSTTEGPEYCTVRSFRFTAWAEYPATGSASLLLSFKETLAFSGGGPLYKYRLAINGPPQRQLVYPQTVYRVTQSGELVGYRQYRTPPGPKWPAALVEAPRVTEESPTRRSLGAYQGYPVRWEYHFESAAPLTGAPTLWIS